MYYHGFNASFVAAFLQSFMREKLQSSLNLQQEYYDTTATLKIYGAGSTHTLESILNKNKNNSWNCAYCRRINTILNKTCEGCGAPQIKKGE